MKTARIASIMFALGASIALAGSASAFGGGGGGHSGGGGHGGGGLGGGGHMGGRGFGGGHMGGRFGGGRSFGGGSGYGLGGFGYDDALGYGGDYGYGYPAAYGYGYGDANPAYMGGVEYSEQPIQSGRSVPVSGNFCRTPVRSCQLSAPTAMGTACSCVSRSNTANGSVAP